MSQVMKTPQSNFSGPIVVDPLTRIEGHLRIEVEVENGRIKDARSCGTLYRGLEVILKGRDPRDAQHFTQRTCGVCTYTHALASTRALEDAMGLTLPANATYIRNLVLGLLFMHDHMVHFYHLHALDFVDVTAALKADPAKAAALASSISPRKATADGFKAVQARLKAFVDSGQLGPFTNAYFLGGHPAYYLDPEANLVATAHYLEALRVQVSAAKAMAVFGAKNPHPQFLIPGGVTCYESLTPERIKEFRDLYLQARKFIEEVYIPDLLLVAGAYKDWAALGCGCRNFMAFGEFPEVGGERDITKRWLKPGVLLDGKLDTVHPFDAGKIAEHVRHSWYEGEDARADETADQPAYDGDAALPYGDDVHEIVPALDGEIDVRAREDIENAAEDDRERDDPQKQLHRVVELKVDTLALEAHDGEPRDHPDDDDDAVPGDLKVADAEGDLIDRRQDLHHSSPNTMRHAPASRIISLKTLFLPNLAMSASFTLSELPFATKSRMVPANPPPCTRRASTPSSVDANSSPCSMERSPRSE